MRVHPIVHAIVLFALATLFIPQGAREANKLRAAARIWERKTP